MRACCNVVEAEAASTPRSYPLQLIFCSCCSSLYAFDFLLLCMYQVYVVELSKKVFTEDARFRQANPQFNGVLECLYVGMTSKTPAERFKQHKTGYINKKGHNLSAAIVYKYGSYLRPSLYNHLNAKPMRREEALAMEKKLALDLRRKGYAVWFN